ncbi:MAG: hypothetical protein LBR07_03785, partial [Puniceicoccales bacterium]|nr:hypothetical protein [Puniceicoccales bacterium]
MLRKEFLLTLAPALLGAFATRSRAAAADDDDANVIKHRFVMLDEARKQLLYEDQFDPAKSWRIPTLDKMGATGNGTGGGNAAKPRVRAGWGLQLVGDHCVLTAMQGLGWREYDLQKRAAVREVADPRRYAGAIGAARFPDGRTVLACEGRRLKLFVFDAAGGETSAVEFGEISSTRQIRRTPRGTLLLGSADERAFEVSLDGKILRRFRVPGAKYNFQVSELPNGHLLVAAGYAKFVC